MLAAKDRPSAIADNGMSNRVMDNALGGTKLKPEFVDDLRFKVAEETWNAPKKDSLGYTHCITNLRNGKATAN